MTIVNLGSLAIVPASSIIEPTLIKLDYAVLNTFETVYTTREGTKPIILSMIVSGVAMALGFKFGSTLDHEAVMNLAANQQPTHNISGKYLIAGTQAGQVMQVKSDVAFSAVILCAGYTYLEC